MKLYCKLILIGMLLLPGFFIGSASHPIKLTSSLILYNAKESRLEMECRVFIDDFTLSINSTFTKNINLTNLSSEDKIGLESYFNKYYPITINNKKFPLKYQESKVLEEHNVFIVRFTQEVLPIKSGDQLCIENTLFFEEFAFLQTNMITVRIPPFIRENYYEATFKNFSIPIDL